MGAPIRHNAIRTVWFVVTPTVSNNGAPLVFGGSEIIAGPSTPFEGCLVGRVAKNRPALSVR